MSESMAFPSALNPFTSVAQPIPVPERGVHIPAAYVRNPHADPEHTVVTQHGVPILGMDGKHFTVAQVAEERRWAIQQSGEVLHVYDFSERMKQNILEFFQMLRDRGNHNAKYEGDINNEPIPDIVKYVSMRVDPSDHTKLIPIGYDKNRTRGAKADAFWDGEGERLKESRLDMLVKAYHDRRLRGKLTDRELEEVREHLQLTGDLDTDGVAARLEELTSLFRDGAITQEVYVERVGALTGNPTPVTVETAEPSPAPLETVDVPATALRARPEPPLMTARCGASGLRGMKGKLAHERRCKKCLAPDPVRRAGDPEAE